MERLKRDNIDSASGLNDITVVSDKELYASDSKRLKIWRMKMIRSHNSIYQYEWSKRAKSVLRMICSSVQEKIFCEKTNAQNK